MTRWKKDEKEFDVKLTFDGTNSWVCRVPKPILEKLGMPEKIKFVLEGKKIEVKPS
ncbi:MAG: hypothetical protein KGI25_02795 [Thaumarchaeota archaeon]|nr:hypothetical protein [Nitrososphaerota archaeon]